MKQYDSGDCGIFFIFNCNGSVIPKTCAWALPAGLLAVAINLFARGNLEPEWELEEPTDYKDIALLWSGFSFMIGFLITFRTATAYNRWWEGATLLQQARGEWVNAYSNCIAFCTDNPGKQTEVKNFREYFAFLLSLLFASALNAITQAENNFETLDLLELPADIVNYLHECSDPVEVIMLWIQTLVVQNDRTKVIDVPPPVLTRVFQELSRGVVNINNIRKIAVLLFPFPYAQLIGALLIFFTALTPIITGFIMDNYLNAFVLTFISVFALVAINFVAMEIECPFGTDPNDLPMQAYQEYMNRTLELLLEEKATCVPRVEFNQVPGPGPGPKAETGFRKSRVSAAAEVPGLSSQNKARKSLNSNAARPKVDFSGRQKLITAAGRREDNIVPGIDAKKDMPDYSVGSWDAQRQTSTDSNFSSGVLNNLTTIPESQEIPKEKGELPKDLYEPCESPKLTPRFQGFANTGPGRSPRDTSGSINGSNGVHFQGFRLMPVTVPPTHLASDSGPGTFSDMFSNGSPQQLHNGSPQQLHNGPITWGADSNTDTFPEHGEW